MVEPYSGPPLCVPPPPTSPPPFLLESGVGRLNQIFKKRGLERISIYRGELLGKREVSFFTLGCKYLQIKKFNTVRIHWKIWFFIYFFFWGGGWGVHEKTDLTLFRMDWGEAPRVSHRCCEHGGSLQNLGGGGAWVNTCGEHDGGGGLKSYWKIPTKEFIC